MMGLSMFGATIVWNDGGKNWMGDVGDELAVVAKKLEPTLSMWRITCIFGKFEASRVLISKRHAEKTLHAKVEIRRCQERRVSTMLHYFKIGNNANGIVFEKHLFKRIRCQALMLE